MSEISLPICGFNDFDDEYSFELETVVKALRIVIPESSIIINERCVCELAERDIINLWTDYPNAGDILIEMAKSRPDKPRKEDMPKSIEVVMIRKKEAVKLLNYLLGEIKGNVSELDVKPEPKKGDAETLMAWMKYEIQNVRGLDLAGDMPDGLQAELIRDSGKYGYKDASVVKRAWSKLGLKSVRSAKKMKKPPKAP